ncbi:MAG: hypothetical protein RLN72_00030 [Henriciella sp.]
MDDQDEVLTPEEAKRRASIRYILRRRGRANKLRANSGSKIKSWAEYSEVNFKPDGDSSAWAYLPTLVLLSLLVVIPFAFSNMRPPLEIEGAPILLMVLVYLIGAMLVVGLGVFLLASVRMFWRLHFERDR